jgi:hypothetical protein
MIIPEVLIKQCIYNYNINIRGILHIGAHDCEELAFYHTQLLIDKNNIIWIDALYSKVKQASDRGIPNVFNALITDKDDDIRLFNTASESSSSSLLEFKRHSIIYPEIVYNEHRFLKTLTIDSFFIRNNINAYNFNVWNIIIQGAELLALKGTKETIRFADVIITKIFTEELYNGCVLLQDIDLFLNERGFIRIITETESNSWGEAVYIKQSLQLLY